MRESLSGRLGFIMLAAGCAVGLGNVWRFPYIAGRNGGGAFVLAYVAFLFMMGLPLLAAELALGRRSRLGVTGAFAVLSPPGRAKAWRRIGLAVFAGNFALMVYYTDVAGWLFRYVGIYAAGGGAGLGGRALSAFKGFTAQKGVSAAYMALAAGLAGAACAAGVMKGVERCAKAMMVSLLVLLGVLAAKALTLPGAAEAVEFYLTPDWSAFARNPGRLLFDAMGQAFFTLSVGIGCMAILGSYTDRRHSLVKESLLIIAVDTAVALAAGLVVFPACFSYGVDPQAGPGLVFAAMPEIFAKTPGGGTWGFFFFLFLSFAAFTTVMAVFECLVGGAADETRAPRPVCAAAVACAVAAFSLPCVLFDGVLEWEDFAVSQIWLPLGALAECVFVSTRIGWGWEGFRAEASEGAGPSVPRWMRPHFAVVLPVLIVAVLVYGLAAG